MLIVGHIDSSVIQSQLLSSRIRTHYSVACTDAYTAYHCMSQSGSSVHKGLKSKHILHLRII